VAKAEALHQHYSDQFGSSVALSCTLNWSALFIRRHDLSALDKEIDEDEIYRAVMQQTPSEKAPGLDGYTGVFYMTCWSIIKDDLIPAIQQIFELRPVAWELLNSANVTLLPKKEGAETITDYRPISQPDA
jgi:hypothetical protein